MGEDDFASSPAIAFGSAGYAAVAPDYLGLGIGPGPHPWMDVPSETTASLDVLRHPTGRFAAALRVSDGVCLDWTPRVPVRLYMADQDEQAVNANAHRCQAALRASGTESEIVTLPEHTYYGSTHLGSSVTGVAAALRWFDRLR